MLSRRIIATSLAMTMVFSLLPNRANIVKAAVPNISVESFEETSVISGETAEWEAVGNGKIELSTKHAKAGNNSLKWTWKKGDKLITTDLNKQKPELEYLTKNGGIKMHLYNEKASDRHDVYYTINIGSEDELDQNNPRLIYKIYADFIGWKAVWVHKNHGKNPSYNGNNIPTVFEIVPPESEQAGSLYIDFFDLVETASITSEGIFPYQEPLAPILPEEKVITPEQIEDFKKIEQKFDKYLMGDKFEVNSADESLKIRYDSMQLGVKSNMATFDSYNLHRDEDGIVRGPGLFSAGEKDIDGTPLINYDANEKIWLPLVNDYKYNGNLESKQKYYDMLDWFDDQGWKAGFDVTESGLRRSGYFYSLYLMRNELKKDHPEILAREREKLRWYCRFSNSIVDITNYGCDSMRVNAPAMLFYVLLCDDTPEKVRLMNGVINWIEEALTINSSYLGIIKPGYTGYHHSGIYTAAYSNDAMFAASLLRYVLDDTSFELDDTVTNNIEGNLKNLHQMSNKYDIHNGISGRGPESTSPMYEDVISYALNALCDDDDDTMKGIFLNINDYGSKKFNAYHAPNFGSSIYYKSSLGELQFMKAAAEQFKNEGVTSLKPKKGFDFKDYGSIAFNRQDNWLIFTKGFNQYNWDYELMKPNQNIFGRYLSYGNTQILLDGGKIASGLDISKGWNYSRLPGATTKNIPAEDLVKSGKHRTYSDETFAGGVSSQGEFGMFSMRMHDRCFDSSFRANKSWFYFGNEIICLGSDIENADKEHNTETTLFQSNMNNDETMPFYNNGTTQITKFPYKNSVDDNSKVWMLDPYGNGYIIPNTQGLNIERNVQNSYDKTILEPTTGKYTTAWLDHGTAPTGGEYEYVILPQKSPEQVKAAAEKLNYEVLQKDNSAHILKHNDYNAIAYAVYDTSIQLNYSAVSSVDTPVLMLEKKISDDNILFSLSDPDLRLSKALSIPSATEAIKPSEHKNVKAEFNGSWNFKGKAPQGVVIDGYNPITKKTEIIFDCYAGINYELNLVKTVPTNLIFGDNFDSGLGNWENIENATITVAPKELTLTNSLLMKPVVNFKDESYTFEADIKRGNGPITIAYRIKDDSNFYKVDIAPLNETQDSYRIYRVVNNSVTTLTGFTIPILPENTKSRLKIEFAKAKTTVFLNDVIVATQEDSKYNYPEMSDFRGGIGLRAQNTIFDNIKVTSSDSADPIFSENFEGDLSKWVNTDGASITGVGDHDNLRLTNNSAILSKNSDGISDYTLDTAVKILSGKAGIVFHSQDKNNYYQFKIDSANGKAGFYKQSGDKETELATVENAIAIAIDTIKTNFANIKLCINKNDFTASINDKEILKATDATYSSGKVGFSAPTQSDIALFDNFAVTAYLENKPDPENAVTSIAIKTTPAKTTYEVGGTLDVTGGKITVTYEDNTTKYINMAADMISIFDSSKAVSEQALTITYEGKVAPTTFKIKVEQKSKPNDVGPAPNPILPPAVIEIVDANGNVKLDIAAPEITKSKECD